MKKSDNISDFNFESIVESSRDAIMRFDRKHRHLYVNKATEELTGISRNNFLGKTHDELGFPDDLCKLWGEAIDYVFENEIAHRVEFTLPNNVVIDWLLTPEANEEGGFNTILTTARDITQISDSKKELIDNQSRFKDAFQLARLSTWEVDVKSSRTILNQGFCDIIGVKFDEKHPYLDSAIYYNDFVYEDDKALFVQKIKDANESNDSNYQDILNYRITHTDGSLISIMATIRIRYNENGEQLAFYGTFQDITSIKIIEEELAAHKLHLEDLVEQRTAALRQSESKLQDAVDLAKLSTWQFDIKTEKLSVSGVLENKLKKERFEKRNTLKLEQFVEDIHPDDFKGFYGAVEKAMTTTDKNYYDIHCYRMYDVARALRYVNITIKVRFDETSNHPDLLYGTIQDVTYLIESKIEKERLTSIIEATSDIVLVADVNRNIIYLNKAGKRFFNFGDDNRLNQYPVTKLFVGVKESDIVSVLEIVEKEDHWIGEGKIKKHDGSIIPVSEVIVAHKNHINEIDCYSITLRDLSNQKKIENDLVYKNTELDTFVYRASHDLRGPIASLLGLYNVVKHEISEPTSLKFFEMYNNQIIRLNETILALIDLTRIKEQNTKREAIDIRQIVQGSINSFTHLPQFEEVTFDINIDVDHQIVTDKSLITTITQNLIENAIKYSRDDVQSFVKVNILLNEIPNAQLVINVEDNGIGIEKEIHSKVFDMFFRGNTHAIGSGLGLYILKNATEKLNGKINLKSKQGSGTSMTVRIPVAID